MRVLIDANILLDVALFRPGLIDVSSAALRRCEEADREPFMAWHTVSNVYYILRNNMGHQASIDFIKDLLEWVTVAESGHLEAVRACQYSMRDFEDALQVSAAQACGAEVIITRNTRDFAGTPVPAITPEQFLEMR